MHYTEARYVPDRKFTKSETNTNCSFFVDPRKTQKNQEKHEMLLFGKETRITPFLKGKSMEIGTESTIMPYIGIDLRSG